MQRGSWLNRSGSGPLVCVLVLAALTMAGCQDKSLKTSDKDLQLVTLERVDEFLADTKTPTVLVDVRSPKAFAAGHLPGAVNIPLPQIRQHDVRLATAQVIIVYAEGWADGLGPAGAKKLIANGYANVFDFRGGMQDWQKAGRDVQAAADGG